jgi:hypothetical protein
MWKPTLFAAALVLLAGCSSADTDLLKTQRAYSREDVRENAADFEQAMLAFISKAQAGDADGLVALTGRTTIATSGGPGGVRARYLAEVIPLFRNFPSQETGGADTIVKDTNGLSGWAFKRTFQSPDNSETRVEITLFREDGRLVVTYVGPWASP